MINQKMAAAINQQINAELYSSYLYLAMAAGFKESGLDGFANWMQVQAQEELTHAMKFYSYLNERDGRVELEAIDKPPCKWEKPLAAFQAAYGHEQKVTALINDLVELAQEVKDHATQAFLQWFVNEQVEEEANAKALVDKLKLVGDNPQGLFMIDDQLAARTFVMPPATGAAAE
jgi:ferritin